jgi:hypothetical protein
VDSGSAFHNLYLGALHWLDYDNDGDLDLLLAGNTGGLDVLRLYRNNNVAANAAPGAPSNLAVSRVGTGVEFSWNAATDDHTPSPGLGYNLRVGTTPGGSQVVSPQSDPTGYRRLAALGNVQSGLSARLGHLVPGTTYYWSVQSVDAAFAGSPFAAEGSFTFTVAAVENAGVRTALSLSAAPNPFTGPIRISYALPSAQSVQLGIFDLSGRRTRMLVREFEGAGRYTLSWDGRDDRGRPAPGGAYFVRLQTGTEAASRVIVLSR